MSSCRTTVRFSPVEYRRITRQQLLTGRSIPWLLKTRFFNSAELQPPAFDYETSRELIRQIAAIGNNLNQIAKGVNSGIAKEVSDHIKAMHKLLEDLHALAMRDYGHR
ncbi:MobC family plasmid mobilization relaxosome protein [Bdellovibrionota bacterium FG-2]